MKCKQNFTPIAQTQKMLGNKGKDAISKKKWMKSKSHDKKNIKIDKNTKIDKKKIKIDEGKIEVVGKKRKIDEGKIEVVEKKMKIEEKKMKIDKKKFKSNKPKMTFGSPQSKFNKKPGSKGKKTREKNLTGESPAVKKFGKKELITKGAESVEEQIKLFKLKKKQRKLIRKEKESGNATFQRSKKLKVLWEELRKDTCEEEQKNKLLEDASKLIKGHAKELTYAHDTVRVLECVFGSGTLVHKTMLFDELKDSIVILAKSKYAKFILIKVLRNGSKEQKNHILKEFHSKVIELISHTEAAEVVEVAFNECASSSQRTELTQEFYGPSFRYFKDTDDTLKKVLEKDPEKKPAIIQHMKEVIAKLFKKSVIKHSIVHYILREFLVHADQASRLEVIDTIRPVVAEILHTKDGARAAMFCVWHGTTKDRKAIVKSLKTHVSKIAKEEHGHLVLLAIFDCVDDTKLLEKHIISELLSDILDLSKNLHGRKVLLYLISPRDKLHFCPDMIKILQEGDNNETSKKDAEKRRMELKESVVSPLMKLVIDHISDLYTENAFCLETFTILKNSVGYRIQGFQTIVDLVTLNYSNDMKKMHIIESPGSSFMLKKLIMEDKSVDVKAHECFSKVLVEAATTEAIKSWTDCNRGCFLLVNLLETGIPSVIDTIKAALLGYHTQLSKKSFSGATILLKKIKTN